MTSLGQLRARVGQPTTLSRYRNEGDFSMGWCRRGGKEIVVIPMIILEMCFLDLNHVPCACGNSFTLSWMWMMFLPLDTVYRDE